MDERLSAELAAANAPQAVVVQVLQNSRWAKENYVLKLAQVLSLSGLRFQVSIVQEHASCEEEMKVGGNNLGGRIRIISGGGIVEGVFALVEEAFDWLIGIVGGLENDVVAQEVGCQDASVFVIKMRKDVARGYI